jgi:hypothetical protein
MSIVDAAIHMSAFGARYWFMQLPWVDQETYWERSRRPW